MQDVWGEASDRAMPVKSGQCSAYGARSSAAQSLYGRFGCYWSGRRAGCGIVTGYTLAGEI